MKRFLEFQFEDGSSKRIQISKVTTLSKKAPKVGLHLDKIDDGYLMIINEDLWDIDSQKLNQIKIIKE